MNASELLYVVQRLGRPRVLVLGDVILDRYAWGQVERISPEAPVPVLRVERRESRLGGAGNVCYMACGLEAEVSCAGVVGDDLSGREVRSLLQEAHVDTSALIVDDSRPTTTKERFMGRATGGQSSQILRADEEERHELNPEVADRLLQGLREQIAKHDVLLISDYAKGVCTSHVVREAIQEAKRQNVPVLVDPARKGDYRDYAHATILKPNRVEAALASNTTIQNGEDAIRVGARLCQNLEVDHVLITLDSDGIALARRDGSGEVFPTQPRSVFDVTGAGDVVLAMLGICLGGGAPVDAAMQLCNIAAGLEVERMGVCQIAREEVHRVVMQQCGPGVQKLVSLEDAARLAEGHRQRGEKIVFTNGCFDLLHVGHVSYLTEAASMGDILVVAINSDASVRKLKGPSRPVISESDRSVMLAALGCVDYVLVFDDDTPIRMLEAIRPDILIKGGTYSIDGVVGREVVEAYGGQVRLAGKIDGVSTTAILQSLDQNKTKQKIADKVREEKQENHSPLRRSA